MANTLLTHSMIAERALFDLQNNLSFTRNAYKGYNSEFTSVGRFKKGSSVTVALPNRYRTKNGAAIDTVDTNETSTTVTVDTQEHVAFSITSSDLTLKVEDFSTKHLVPATIALANKIDADGLSEYKNIYNHVGTPGTQPTTYGVLADGAERMDQEAVPGSPRVSALSPNARWGLSAGELKGVFNENIVSDLVRKGSLGMFAGIDHFMDQNVKTHTTGTHSTGSTPLMNGATAEGATSLVTDGWANSTAVLKQGDVITVAGCVGVNPISGQAWENNTLRQFVVTADVTSDGSGNATISISPTIYSSAAGETVLPYQSIVTLPANNAAITVVSGAEASGFSQNLLFHPDCFAMTMVPFEKPMSAGSSVLWGQASDPQLGLSITVSTQFLNSTHAETTRLDVLYGWDTIRPELGVRLAGA